jgi:hypothetical protein
MDQSQILPSPTSKAFQNVKDVSTNIDRVLDVILTGADGE